MGFGISENHFSVIEFYKNAPFRSKLNPWQQARQALFSAHPETVFLPDLCVMLKILSSEYQLYACGKIFRRP